MKTLQFVFFIPATVALIGGSVQAQWGTLKGRIVLNEAVPVAKPLVVGPVRGLPAGGVIPDESLVIDPKTKGIKHIAIWVVKKPAQIHPDLVAPLQPTVTMNLRGLRFDPHILVVRTGQSIQFRNADPVAHNFRGNPGKNIPFHFMMPANLGNGPLIQMKRPERLPVPVSSDISNWMRAHLLMVDHPYAAVTDDEGRFEIPKLPLGEHEFQFWQERVGYLMKDPIQPKQGFLVRLERDMQTIELDIDLPLKTLTEPRK